MTSASLRSARTNASIPAPVRTTFSTRDATSPTTSRYSPSRSWIGAGLPTRARPCCKVSSPPNVNTEPRSCTPPTPSLRKSRSGCTSRPRPSGTPAPRWLPAVSRTREDSGTAEFGSDESRAADGRADRRRAGGDPAAHAVWSMDWREAAAGRHPRGQHLLPHDGRMHQFRRRQSRAARALRPAARRTDLRQADAGISPHPLPRRRPASRDQGRLPARRRGLLRHRFAAETARDHHLYPVRSRVERRSASGRLHLLEYGRQTHRPDPALSHAEVVEPGRTIINTVTAAHSMLNNPVYSASRAEAATSRVVRTRCWRGRISTARIAAASAVSPIETSTQALPVTCMMPAVAKPNTGIAMPTRA